MVFNHCLNVVTDNTGDRFQVAGLLAILVQAWKLRAYNRRRVPSREPADYTRGLYPASDFHGLRYALYCDHIGSSAHVDFVLERCRKHVRESLSHLFV